LKAARGIFLQAPGHASTGPMTNRRLPFLGQWASIPKATVQRGFPQDDVHAPAREISRFTDEGGRKSRCISLPFRVNTLRLFPVAG
jgi:hypothetical protein